MLSIAKPPAACPLHVGKRVSSTKELRKTVHSRPLFTTSLLGLWKGLKRQLVFILFPFVLRKQNWGQKITKTCCIIDLDKMNRKESMWFRNLPTVVKRVDYSRFVMQFDLLEKIEGRVDIAWGHEMGSRHNCHPRPLCWTVSVLSFQSLHCSWNPCFLAQFFKVQAFEYMFLYFFHFFLPGLSGPSIFFFIFAKDFKTSFPKLYILLVLDHPAT